MFISHHRLTQLILAVAVVALGACTPSEEKVADMAAQAQQLLENGQTNEAHKMILKAIGQRDDLPSVYVVQAHIAGALNNRPEAYQAFANALSLEATNPEALMGVAQLGLGLGHIDDADGAADKILVLDPGQTDALLVKGIVKLVRNDLDQALEYASRILAIKSADVGGLILKSRAMALQGHRADALALIEAGIRKTGESPEMLMSLAELQRASGNGPAFLASLGRIRALAPNNRDYWFDLVDTLYRMGRIDAARTQATALLGEPITSPAELSRFARLWNAYDRDALDPVQLARLAKTASVEIRMSLARYFIGIGRAPAALALLRPVATGWSSDVQALYARAGEGNGQVQAARTAADEILTTDPGNGDALLIRAHLALVRADPKGAVVSLQRIVKDYPEWEEGYLGLAQAYWLAKKPDGVTRAFEDGRRALPQSLPLAQAYTRTLLKLGAGDRANDVARRFAFDSPSLSAAWSLYAAICNQAPTEDCKAEAAAGQERTKTRFGLDKVPGAPPPIALVGRLN